MQTCKIIGLTLLLIASRAAAQPPCDSQLRILFPHLFTHCAVQCRYTEWTSWQHVPNSVATDETGRCPQTGKSFEEVRTRSAPGCETEEEYQRVCVPNQEERLILLLGLGHTTNTNPQGPAEGNPKPQPPSTFGWSRVRINPQPRDVCQGRMQSNQPICRHIQKRAAGYSDNAKSKKIKTIQNVKSANGMEPMPFDMVEHGQRLRRQTNTCQPGDKQHVLFVLDTSGSIGSKNFKNMTTTVANLTALFCKPIEIGVMTFNHQFRLEFCFDCFSADFLGRFKAQKAIRNIPYRAGSTHTGGAAKCVCDRILQPDCGIEFHDETCIDVVFITDGQSNDPTREICNEVQCLHNHRLKVNTYSLGIGNYDRDELKCIQESSNSFSVFEYEKFDDFYASVQKIIYMLANNNNSDHRCANTNGGLGN